MNKEIEEIEKIGEFTQDLRILPNPNIFEKIRLEQQEARANKVKDKIVKSMSDSNDGQANINIEDCEVIPKGEQDPVFLNVKKWANTFGYDIVPSSYYGNGAVGGIKIHPSSVKNKLNGWLSFQIKDISFTRIFIWSLVLHFVIRSAIYLFQYLVKYI